MLLHLRADRHDGHREIRCAHLPHRLDVRRVRLDDVRELLRVALDELRARVDAEHLVAVRDEILRERAAEPSARSAEHTSELQSRQYLVCRLLLEKKTTIS